MRNNSPASDYWLYRWIDDREIRKPGDLHKALRKRSAVDRLIEFRELQEGEVISDSSSLDFPVIAGRRVDLSGRLGCAHFECIEPQIDIIFGRTWHYFDTIIIDDVELSDPESDLGEFLWDVEQRVTLLLHLRKIGASESIAFHRKTSGYCEYHFREFARSNGLGLDVLFDESVENNVVQELSANAFFKITRREDHWHYTISHPGLEPIIGRYSHSDPEIRPSREECARDAFGSYCSALIADVGAARTLQAPLLEVAEGDSIFRKPENADDSLVALNLQLPVLKNVPAKDILKLKRDNWPEFERFRIALRKAINEQIERAGNRSPDEIAKAVVDEYIRDEISKIETGLNSSRKALAKKVGANVAVGLVPVSTGLISHSLLIVAAAAIPAAYAAIKTIMPEVNKQIDNTAEIEKEPNYFLWKARVRHNRSLSGR